MTTLLIIIEVLLIALGYCYLKIRYYKRKLDKGRFNIEDMLSFGQFVSRDEILETDLELWALHESDKMLNDYFKAGGKQVKFSEN